MGVTPIYIITLFLLIVAIGIIMLVLVYQKKQLHYLREKEQLRVTFEKELLESKLEIQEQTFKNISQEIHDNIGQVLTLVNLNIQTLPSVDSENFKTKINDTKLLVSKALGDLRDLSKTLNTDFISELGLVKSIEYELELIKKAGGFQTQLIQEGEPYQLTHQKELIIFRIFQEVSNNIIKHSKATAVSVYITYHPEKFLLEINDNGIGFNRYALKENGIGKPAPGLGIRNIENRSSIIGAGFNLQSEPGRGTTVKITLPVQ